MKLCSSQRPSPYFLSRVTPGISATRASQLFVSRLNKVDLPTLGRPTIAITGNIFVSRKIKKPLLCKACCLTVLHAFFSQATVTHRVYFMTKAQHKYQSVQYNTKVKAFSTAIYFKEKFSTLNKGLHMHQQQSADYLILKAVKRPLLLNTYKILSFTNISPTMAPLILCLATNCPSV